MTISQRVIQSEDALDALSHDDPFLSSRLPALKLLLRHIIRGTAVDACDAVRLEEEKNISDTERIYSGYQKAIDEIEARIKTFLES